MPKTPKRHSVKSKILILSFVCRNQFPPWIVTQQHLKIIFKSTFTTKYLQEKQNIAAPKKWVVLPSSCVKLRFHPLLIHIPSQIKHIPLIQAQLIIKFRLKRVLSNTIGSDVNISSWIAKILKSNCLIPTKERKLLTSVRVHVIRKSSRFELSKERVYCF